MVNLPDRSYFFKSPLVARFRALSADFLRFFAEGKVIDMREANW